MGKIRDLTEKLKTVNEDVINQGLLTIVKNNQSEALDLNTSQLFAGKDSNDQSLGSYKSAEYAKLKLSLNPAGVVDLKLTGNFYSGFFADTSRFPIQFGSTDEKADTLMQTYGQDIFGLDQTNLEQFRQDIKPDIQNLFKSFLQL